MVAAWAERMNLTAHRTPDAVARRLVLDAIAFGLALPLAEPPTLADLGSGAGFPGLPLAILWPRSAVTLVESRERRHHFQRAAVRELGLANATPLRGRIEELPARPHSLVVSQALAEAVLARRWMLPWVSPGGWIALARSIGAPPLEPSDAFAEVHQIEYQVPLGGPRREIWMARAMVGGRSPSGCGT
jgi:16S rRNA (guanine527-N7)-methyltransferase